MPGCACRPGLASLLGAVAGILLAAGGLLWLLGGPAPRPAVGGPFSLLADNGRPVTERSFRGRYMLLYFGYTSCPDVCPVTLSTLAGALDVLGPRAARVQPLFVTVDPARDTPEVLRRYLQAANPAMLGLTGDPAALRRMRVDYHVQSAIHPGGTIDHSSVLYLLGPDGTYLAPIRADEPADAMAADIARHLS